MIRRLIVAVVVLLCSESPQAQGPQVGATIALTMFSVPNIACPHGGWVEQWLMVYGPPPCYLAPGLPNGAPYIVSVRVRITPENPALPPRETTVGRAAVYRTPSATVCAPTPAPCLSVRVPAVSGRFTVEAAFIDGEGRASPWSDALPAEGVRPGLAGVIVNTWRVRP